MKLTPHYCNCSPVVLSRAGSSSRINKYYVYCAHCQELWGYYKTRNDAINAYEMALKNNDNGLKSDIDRK